jgi:hypothetical protein
VSRVSKPARSTKTCPADLEVGDTAGLETQCHYCSVSHRLLSIKASKELKRSEVAQSAKLVIQPPVLAALESCFCPNKPGYATGVLRLRNIIMTSVVLS